MAIRKYIQLHDNKDSPESWCYIADAEQDVLDVPADCQMLFVAVPQTGKTQWRIRKPDGEFVEVKN